jgi:hypothetical protein
VIKLRRVSWQEHVTGKRNMENISYTRVLSENPRAKSHIGKLCGRRKYNIINHLQGLRNGDVGCDSQHDLVADFVNTVMNFACYIKMGSFLTT